jgi:hypothetical protein
VPDFQLIPLILSPFIGSFVAHADPATTRQTPVARTPRCEAAMCRPWN